LTECTNGRSIGRAVTEAMKYGLRSTG
jgi:hypothetical protein